MFKDRRKTTRRTINRLARYQCSPGSLPRTCMVTDISDGGARLYSETPLPDTFILSVKGEGIDGLRRQCQVVWRLGGECGVAFTGAAP